jgi:hypothetical protein
VQPVCVRSSMSSFCDSSTATVPSISAVRGSVRLPRACQERPASAETRTPVAVCEVVVAAPVPLFSAASAVGGAGAWQEDLKSVKPAMRSLRGCSRQYGSTHSPDFVTTSLLATT